MNEKSIDRRMLLKTLGAGALGILRVGPASAALLGQVGTTENAATAQVPISMGNAGVLLMIEVWGRPPAEGLGEHTFGRNLPQDLRAANDTQFANMLKTGKDLGVTGIEYYVS